MPTINLAYVAELILRYARKYAYGIAIIFFITILLAMMASFVTSFILFYNLITHMIEFQNSASFGGTVCQLYGLLSCIGFIQAFDDTKSLIISGVLFLLWRIVFAHFLRAYYLVIQAVRPLVS
ncbi:MAG: hypothetical protein PHU40_05155 [Sulfurimonas sp.]|nr:hypothetical protein [Sulfurimonas sp.]